MKTLYRGLAVFAAFALLAIPHAFAASPARYSNLISAAFSQGPTSLAPPGSLAFFDTAGGTTLYVEFEGAGGAPSPFVDSNGVSWGAVQVTVPAGGTKGLGYLLSQTHPDGTHLLTAASITTSMAVRAKITVLSGGATYNGSGTANAGVGAGNGIDASSVAPTANDYPLGVGTYIIQNGVVTALPDAARVTVTGNITAANAAVSGVPTAGSAVPIPLGAGRNLATIQFTGTWSATPAVIQSNDGVTWTQTATPTPVGGTSAWSSGTNGQWTVPITGKYAYVEASAYVSGTIAVSVVSSPSPGLVSSVSITGSVSPTEIPYGATQEQGSSAGTPITNTASHQIFAAHTSASNYLTDITVQNLGTSAATTEIEILDGATVVADLGAETGGGGLTKTWRVSVKGSTNTILYIKCVTTSANVVWTATGYYL
ncbi:MAG: hypothetical protein KGL39_37500 [Patescibacteria group bacterium]|nr:hypothetical protein [Patescibacteria group bacterium]